jgi:signal transduction histidine kinase
MSRLLSDLLLLSRGDSNVMARHRVDYSEVCRQAIAKLQAQDRRHEVTSDVAGGLQVAGDQDRLSQMVWNVLENAAQYTPAGGRIEARLAQRNGAARISIHDTGPGISQEDLPRIAERFYRGVEARATRSDGTGLGLAIVKYVAEAHGGELAIASQEGQGTSVTIDVPIAP